VGNPVETGSVSDENIETNVVGLLPGSYTIEVTDSNGELKSYSLFVAAITPLEFEYIDVSNPLCYGSNDGSIIVKVKDSQFNPYDIKWSNGVFNLDTVTNLGNGTYGITVVDKTSGCKTDTFVNLSTSKLELDVSKLEDASCEGINDGRILANASGGTPVSSTGYRFRWQTKNNFFTENTPATSILNNAAPGWVYITVNDSVPWCKVSDSVFIDTKYTMELSSSLVDPTCFGDENGLIQYNANLAGYNNDDFDLEFPVFPHPPYSDVQKLGNDQFIINNLGSGRYITKVYEKTTGCFKVDTVQLNEPAPISVNLETNKAGCEGQLAFANFKNISGGSLPYTLTGIGSDTVVLNQSHYIYHDLDIGIYSVHIEDANGCDTTVTFEIMRAEGLLNIDTIMFDLLGCDATATTDITVVASSTHGTIHYTWTDKLGIVLGSDNPVLSNVGAGTYIVSLKDDMCTLKDTIVIPEAKPFTFNVQTTASECGPGESGGFGGSACINIDGDDTGFTYQWSNGLSGKCINDVPAGNYVVTISDIGGCTSVDTIEVPGAPGIEINILDVQGISCNDGQHSDGSAILQATGGDNPAGLFVFNLDDGTNKVGNLVTLNDLAGGINHFTVYYNTINGNTCSKSDSFEVGVPERLTLDLVDSKIIKPTCFGDCDGSIIAKAKGGNNATYFYKWQETGQSGAISTDLCAGTYHV
ncbi:MAG TPA: hypothetical protein ENK91_09060, partial [Bacteroidetes bacterium]|nr:hypothetical protein [Bacteroidota bacterium]